ncbi:MAG: two-component system response regulator [Rhodospirillaceae bacterium]|nr:two-component system response regulator [Rhodospirillaceae bacterium]
MNSYFRKHVLVVDDEKPIRMIVSKLCEKIGFGKVSVAANGLEALTVLRRTPVDLVICDIEMEPINGIQVLHEVRNTLEKPAANAPFIFLTSHAESDFVMTAKQLGADSYVIKPVDVVSLKGRVDQVLGGR